MLNKTRLPSITRPKGLSLIPLVADLATTRLCQGLLVLDITVFSFLPTNTDYYSNRSAVVV
uniref:Uncharacterized protein n=1 Tax=Myoviridae sp. ctijX18 TaxID=2825154 RepID=A0A8S5USM5_9CAUD|nr:MAG TPA: hypothetical protein [Myoviridae sp. ctijX18]DAJ69078.1 MAG TPA: hypothetical protein [Caudoviricetes sp.]